MWNKLENRWGDMKNNHACIVICYLNIEHIKKCFDSIYTPNIDYYIIENKSVNSDEITEYFKSKPVKRYIQFNENISNSAPHIFFNDYKHELTGYDYITFTDGDLYISDIVGTFNEIIKNLKFKEVGMSCVDLDMSNYPHNIDKNKTWIPKPSKITDEYIVCPTGGHLMTLKQELAHIFYNQSPFVDSGLFKSITKHKLIWVKTKIHKAIHLTWDLYKVDNDYYKYKCQKNIWNHGKTSKYIQII